MDYRTPKSITVGFSYLSLPSQEEGQQQLSDLKLLARHKLGRRQQGHTSSQKNTCCSPDSQQALTPRSCQCCIQTRGRNGWDHQRNIYWPNSCFSTCPVSHRYLSAAFFKALSTGIALQQPSEPKLGKMLKTLINTTVTLKAFSVVAIMSYAVSAQNLCHADEHWQRALCFKKPLMVSGRLQKLAKPLGKKEGQTQNH